MEGLGTSKISYEVSKGIGGAILRILKILEDLSKILGDSWRFLGIPGDSWRFLWIPGDSYGFSSTNIIGVPKILEDSALKSLGILRDSRACEIFS